MSLINSIEIKKKAKRFEFVENKNRLMQFLMIEDLILIVFLGSKVLGEVYQFSYRYQWDFLLVVRCSVSNVEMLLLWHGFQDGLDLLGDGCQDELELFLSSYHICPLISKVFQCSSNIDFFDAFSHSVQDQVD